MAGSLLEDIRFALRAFVRHPGFTSTAVLTLALGIGSAAAIWNRAVAADVALAFT